MLPTKNKGNTKKKPISRKKKFKWKVGRRLGQKQKREKTEGATGLGRITREQIELWNQMTALGFQTGGDIRNIRPPFGPLGLNKIY